MQMTRISTLVLSLSAAAFIAGSANAADVTKGKKVYKKCKACHTLKAGGKNKIGPNLNGVIGRKAGSVEGFKYSKAMKASDVVWDEANLDKFLKKPKKFMKKTKMSFAGLKKEKDRVNVIAYIKDATK